MRVFGGRRGIGKKDSRSMGARSVLCGTFVLVLRWLEVKVFCIWGTVMSQCKLRRKEYMKGSRWVGNVGGTKM